MLTKPYLHIYNIQAVTSEKGKLFERIGRKAMGLKHIECYDSRLPFVNVSIRIYNVWFSPICLNSDWAVFIGINEIFTCDRHLLIVGGTHFEKI